MISRDRHLTSTLPALTMCVHLKSPVVQTPNVDLDKMCPNTTDYEQCINKRLWTKDELVLRVERQPEGEELNETVKWTNTSLNIVGFLSAATWVS